MSSIKPEAKRYQNPELFERLAMEYAIGIMHGRARKRFKALMEKHLYLRATTEAYEHQFARFSELLPEKRPSDRVWKRIEKQTNKHTRTKKVKSSIPWWRSLQAKMVGLAASVVFAVSAFFVLLPATSVEAYVAVLESHESVPMAMATAKKDDGIYVQLMNDMDVPENMELKLWCLSKKEGEKPMMMGVLEKSGASTIKIDEKMWQGLVDVSAFAISMELEKAENLNGPEGEVLYTGALQAMEGHS